MNKAEFQLRLDAHNLICQILGNLFRHDPAGADLVLGAAQIYLERKNKPDAARFSVIDGLIQPRKEP